MVTSLSQGNYVLAGYGETGLNAVHQAYRGLYQESWVSDEPLYVCDLRDEVLPACEMAIVLTDIYHHPDEVIATNIELIENRKESFVIVVLLVDFIEDSQEKVLPEIIKHWEFYVDAVITLRADLLDNAWGYPVNFQATEMLSTVAMTLLGQELRCRFHHSDIADLKCFFASGSSYIAGVGISQQINSHEITQEMAISLIKQSLPKNDSIKSIYSSLGNNYEDKDLIANYYNTLHNINSVFYNENLFIISTLYECNASSSPECRLGILVAAS